MKHHLFIKSILSGILLFLAMLLITSWDVQWDLTPDKRYTLNPMVYDLVNANNESFVITSYLEGEVPASFRNYKDYIEYYISELRRYDRGIELDYRNPVEGEDAAEFQRFLSTRGVEPIRRKVSSKEEVNLNLLYPYISIHDNEEIVFVNLLEPQIPGESEEESLLRSQLAFEGKLLRALRQLIRKSKPEIHVLGHRPSLLAEGMNRDPRLDAYQFIASNSRQLLSRRDSLDAIVAVVKREDLQREELLAIDVLSSQSIPVIWLIDKFDITLDSLRATGNHLAIARDFQVEDYLFRMGVKINPQLIMDLQATSIPQVVNDGSNTPQTRMMQFPFHPLIITGVTNPPETRLSGPLPLFYCSPIESNEVPRTVQKKVLLTTSPYTQVRTSPIPVNFGFMRLTPDPEEYKGGTIPVGIGIEGRIRPYFTNRLTTEDNRLLQEYGLSYPRDSQYIEQILVTDTDFIIPNRGSNGGVFPIGYNPADRQMYDASTQLIANLLEKLIDGPDLLMLSNRKSDLTILDRPRYERASLYYQFLLLGCPLVLLALSYFIYHWLRKRKYAR